MNAACQLILREGVTVSTAEIARSAGVANGTLFNYFPTKQDLLDALYVDAKQDVLGAFEVLSSSLECKDLNGIFSALWETYIYWAIKNPEKHRVMHTLKGANVISASVLKKAEAMFQPLENLLEQDVSSKIFGNIEPAYRFKVIEAQMGACIDYALEHRLKGEQLAQHIAFGFSVFWNGVSGYRR